MNSRSYSQTIAGFMSDNLCYGSISHFISNSSISGTLDSMIWIVDQGFAKDTFRAKKIDTISYFFLSSGTFTVTLIIKSSVGNDTITKNVTIESIATISFTIDTNIQKLSNNVFNFASNVIVNPSGTAVYTWKFDDGHTLSGTNPTYSYSSAGAYNVWLLAQTSNGCLDSMDGNLLVTNDIEDVVVDNTVFYVKDTTTTVLYSNLTVSNTGNFKNDGHTLLSAKITNNGGKINGNGKYELIGTAGSIITVLPGDTFSFVEVNKASPNSRVELKSNTNINYLVFRSNNLVYADNDTLYITNPSDTSIVGYDSGRYIVGYLSRQVASSKIYNYPIGTSSEYHNAVIDIDTLNSINYITGRFYTGNKYKRLLNVKNEGPYDSLHPKGTWQFWPTYDTTGTPAITYDLSLSLNQFGGLTDNGFAILKKDATAPDLAFQPGGGVLPAKNTYGRMVSNEYAKRTGYTSFSEFGIGMGENEIRPGIVLCLRAFLEGPYSAIQAKMDTNYIFQDTLKSHHYKQPYNNAPWNYKGIESFDSNSLPSPTIIDWMLISLRTSTAASSTFDTIAVLVRNDGYLVNTKLADSIVMMKATNLDSFYIVLQHRNHLAIMTASKTGRQYGLYKYDFTTSVNKAYNQGAAPMKNMGAGAFAMWAGNVTGDANVNSLDYTQWRKNNGLFKYHGADVNLELNINSADYTRWRINNGRSTQVPQ